MMAGNVSEDGGAMYQYSGPVRNCLVVGNYALDGGAASHSRGLVHSTVAHNRANGLGGAFWNGSSSSLNSIIFSNASDIGASEFGQSVLPKWSCVTDAADIDTGGIAADPLFLPSETGIWSDAAISNSDNFVTVFTDALANWPTGSLAGKHLNPNTAQPLIFLIADNSGATVTVWGDAASLGGVGVQYEIRDYHLQAQSPCIDRASKAASSIFSDITTGPGTTAQLHPAMVEAYEVGDEIEYANDRVMRTVIAVDTNGGAVTVDDPLPAPSEAGRPINNFGFGDFDGADRVQFCRPDMGAFETANYRDCNSNGLADGCETTAGTAPDCNDNGVPDECENCADLDGNGLVSANDYQMFRETLGRAAGDPAYSPCADYDASGAVGFGDFQVWLGCYRDFIGDPLASPPALAGHDDPLILPPAHSRPVGVQEQTSIIDDIEASPPR
jgi:hypothetical protein